MSVSRVPSPIDELLEHDRFVRNLAVSLVADGGLADDLVQETYLTALRRPPQRLDRVREWLFVVLRNHLRQHARGESRRHGREAAQAPREVATPQQILERESARRELITAVTALPEPCRSVVLLRYFEDLPPRKIARELGVPVETVKTRLKRALAKLRSTLGETHGGRSWQWVIVPLLGPPRSVTPATVTTTATLSAGGLIMSKPVAITLALVVSLALAFVIGRESSSWISTVEEGDGASELAGAVVADGDASSRLQSENQRLRQELQRLGAELATTTEKLQRLESRAETDSSVAGVADPDAIAGDGPATIDWTRLATLIADNQGIFEELAALRTEGQDSWPPVNMKWLWESHLTGLSEEEQSALREFMLEWTRAAALAKRDGPYPFFDSEILPRLLESLVSEPLGLSGPQLERWLADAGALATAIDPGDDVTPLEAFASRSRMVDALIDSLAGSLDATQGEAWDRLQPLFGQLLTGDYTTASVGVSSPEQARRHLLRELNEEYPVSDPQQGELQRIADEYLLAARRILEDFRQLGDDPRPLNASARRELDAAFHELQLRQEAAIMRLLSETDLDALRYRPPKLFTFGAFEGFRGNSEVIRGF